MKMPVDLELRSKNYRPAELLAYLPNVERVDARSVRSAVRTSWGQRGSVLQTWERVGSVLNSCIIFEGAA